MDQEVDNANTTARRPSGWQIVEKIVIPLALVALAASQVQVAREQVRVAEVQAERQRDDANSNLQLKYVELFYRDLTDPDSRKKASAVALLAVMRPDIARTLTSVIYADPNTGNTLRQQASSTLVTASRFGSLVSYRLVVYYERATRPDAERLQAKLRELGFRNELTLRERGRAFLADATKYGYHIRFDGEYELDAATYLSNLMPECLPGETFRTIRVVGKTGSDGVITVFLFK